MTISREVESSPTMSTLRWYLVAMCVSMLCACVSADRMSPSIVSRRAATSDDDRCWPNENVFYTFGTRLLAAQDRSFQFAIRNAMNKLEEQTCLRFFYWTVQTDYIDFTATDANRCACTRGYYSCCKPKFVGNNGGKQVIKLGRDCNSSGIVMHLIGHTVGFRHEHTRPDRDMQLCEYHQSFCAEQYAMDKFTQAPWDWLSGYCIFLIRSCTHLETTSALLQDFPQLRWLIQLFFVNKAVQILANEDILVWEM